MENSVIFDVFLSLFWFSCSTRSEHSYLSISLATAIIEVFNSYWDNSIVLLIIRKYLLTLYSWVVHWGCDIILSVPASSRVGMLNNKPSLCAVQIFFLRPWFFYLNAFSAHLSVWYISLKAKIVKLSVPSSDRWSLDSLPCNVRPSRSGHNWPPLSCCHFSLHDTWSFSCIFSPSLPCMFLPLCSCLWYISFLSLSDKTASIHPPLPVPQLYTCVFPRFHTRGLLFSSACPGLPQWEVINKSLWVKWKRIYL